MNVLRPRAPAASENAVPSPSWWNVWGIGRGMSAGSTGSPEHTRSRSRERQGPLGDPLQTPNPSRILDEEQQIIDHFVEGVLVHHDRVGPSNLQRCLDTRAG